MKCVVTGGAGFIGSHLCELLIKNGHNVIAIDDLSTGQLSNLDSLIKHSDFEFLEGDILKLPELDYVVSKADIVYHLAAAVGVDLVVKDPVRTILTNVKGTERILEAAAKNKTRLLVASTSEVYGKSDEEKFSEENDLLIGSPKHSRWTYACSKLLDEFYCLAYYKEYNHPIVVVRLFNTVGPRQTGKYGMVVPRFIKSAINNETLQVYGTGKQTRCFCHVKDTIRAIYGLGNSNISGEIYNIGSNWKCSIEDLANLIIERTDSKSKIEYIPYEKAYAPGFEDMLHRVPDTDKIKSKLNWNTSYTLNDIIEDVAAYYKEK
ncbi:MAG: NAD-dependent epimerase/dehydratase family protein [bacterium]|nr:NAD-dependent epimerase/dehydratase family protein [bacterium]